MSLKQNIYGSLFVSNNITGNTLNLSTINENNSLTQLLVRDNINGTINYRDVSSIISAATSADTFVTGFTYDDSNNLTISRNDDIDFSVNIDTMSALTVTSLSGVNTIQDDGGELTIISDDIKIKGDGITIQDNGGNDKISIDTTISTPELTGEISFIDNQTFSSNVFVSNVLTATTISATTYFGDGSNLTGIPDNFVSGGTYNSVTENINFVGNSVGTTFDVNLSSLVSSISGDTFVVSGNANAGTSELTFTYNTGGTFTVTNSAALFSDNDINVTGGTYNPSNGCVTFGTNSGTTFDVCGFVTGITDTYTTGSTLVGETIQFDNNILGLNYYNVNLSPVLSGKTNNSTFNTYTSDTQNILNSKVSGATNLSTTGLFAQKNGNNLEFKGLTSTGGSVTISNDSTTVNLEVVTVSDTNTFVSGGTYNESTDTITFTNTTGGTFNVTGVTDTFTTGATYDNGTTLATFTKNDGTSYTLDLSTIDVNDTFVTGFTYNDANTFTISDNNGDTFNTTINIMTGFTVNNGTGDGFVTINSASGQELEINQRGNNFNYSTPNIKVGSAGANMMVGSTGGIGSYPAGSYPGLNLNTTTGNIFLFNGGYGGTGAVMDFQGGNIRDIHDIQSSSNWPLKLYGGPGPNDANDGIQMYTADNLNVYTKKFEIKADTGTPNAYFTNINNLGVNTITPQTTLDVNGTTRLLGLTANTLNLVNTPTLNNSGTDILIRNSSTGEVEYRPVSGITTGTNTFVSGTTFSSNQATVTRNDGVDVLLLTGGTKISLSNPSSNQIKIDVTPELNITTVSTTTYTATTSDEIIGVDTSSNAVTITLPDSLSSGTLKYEIKDIGFNSRSNPITIQAVGSDSIRTTSLVSSFTLSADGGAVVLINTATREWWQM